MQGSESECEESPRLAQTEHLLLWMMVSLTNMSPGHADSGPSLRGMMNIVLGWLLDLDDGWGFGSCWSHIPQIVNRHFPSQIFKFF